MTASPIRIAQVCMPYIREYGGIPAIVSLFSRVFSSQIVTFVPPNLLDSLPNRADVHAVVTRKDALGRLFYWPSPRATDEAEEVLADADLVVCHGLYRYLAHWARRTALRLDKPYWVVPHGGLDPYVFTYRAAQKRAWMRLAGQALFRDARQVIYATGKEREKASAYVDVYNGRVIHWPVELPAIPPRPDARARVRASLGIPAEARVLLYLGRLHESKRPLETIGAVGQLGCPDLHLILVGPDETISRADCARYAAERGIVNIHAIGPVYGDARFDYFAAADGYILLSFKENFGLGVAEAMSCGLPVIIAPGIDLSQDLRTLGCGWLLESGEHMPTIVAAIGEFASASADSLKEMGRKGRSFAETELAFETFAQRVMALAAESMRH